MAVPLGLVGAGAAGVGYGWLEARWFALRHVSVPVLAPGADPLTVLHLSDAHLVPNQGRKRDWLRGLADLEPDLVVSTGDHLAHHDAVPPLLESYGELLERPGVFVFGSNDYFAPVPKNPLRYLVGGTGTQAGGSWNREPTLPFEELRSGLVGAGWLDLNNSTGHLDVGGRPLRSRGSTTRTSSSTTSTRSRRQRSSGPTPSWRSRWPTRRTCGCSIARRVRATRSCWPVTPTGASSASRSTARSRPTATSTADV